jgi:hypothetical protein
VLDWATVKTEEDIRSAMAQRDSYPAAIIKREILAKGKKALVIYGNAHFGMPGLPVELGPIRFLRDVVEEDHPNAFFIVMPYWGFLQKDCSAASRLVRCDRSKPAEMFRICRSARPLAASGETGLQGRDVVEAVLRD